MRWLAVLALLSFSTVVAHAGPDWQLNPICAAAEFPDAAALKVCRDWISQVRQPVYPGMEDQSRATCCSEADAYEADRFEIGEMGEHYAVITRDYPDHKAGERIFIPQYKFNLAYIDGGNPTGHGIVFMNSSGVLCYFSPSLQ